MITTKHVAPNAWRRWVALAAAVTIPSLCMAAQQSSLSTADAAPDTGTAKAAVVQR